MTPVPLQRQWEQGGRDLTSQLVGYLQQHSAL